MNKDILQGLVDLNFSQREIAIHLNFSQSNVKYWLKKLNIKTNKSRYNKKELTEKYCPKCKNIKSIDEFYRSNTRKNGNSHCKKCSNQLTTERQINMKIRMIEYKGGECNSCRLKLENSHYSVFDFHHIDSNNKDINFKHIKSQNWNKIKFEIDKCELLGSNCHRIKHAIIGK
jgi:predicted transcriptional regulator